MVNIYRKRYPLFYNCMRITTLLIGIQACFATILLAGNINAQTIDLDVQHTNVKQVFLGIEKQTRFTFVYNEKELRDLDYLTLKVVKKPLAEVLKEISKRVPLQFKQSGNVIGVSRAAKPQPDISSPKNLEIVPPTIIKGKVTDENDHSVSGVTISVKGTETLTTTNDLGYYSINASAGTTLVFTSIGYKRAEIIIKDQTMVNLILIAEVSPLDEVQVIAYGTTTERQSTGALAKVGTKDIEQQPVSNPLAALEGRVPGLFITPGLWIAR